VRGTFLAGRRTAVLALLIALVVLAGALMWLRSSPFLAVEHVGISGVSGPEAGAIDASLQAAARRMSTMDVSDAALRAAVAQFPVVRSLQTHAKFPHGLRVVVEEQLPVAVMSAGGAHTAVAGDGAVLGPALVSGSLPVIDVPFLPATGRRAGQQSTLAYLTVLGSAPRELLRFVSAMSMGVHGLTLRMRNGLTVYFGDDRRPHAKWLALVEVLADPGSSGADYVDVRLPSRPAAGFPGGVVPVLHLAGSESAGSETGSGESTGESAGTSQSTVAALAAALSAGSGVSASQSATSPNSTPSTSSPSTSQAPAASSGETSTTEPGSGEAAAPGSTEASSPAATGASG